MRNSWLLALLCAPMISIAQPTTRQDTGTHATQWDPIRENDILWRRRVWRTIDVYAQTNWAFRDHSGTPPQNMFANVLLSGIRAGKYSAYKEDDTAFTAAMPIYDLNALVRCDTNSLPEHARRYINFRNTHIGDTTDLFFSSEDTQNYHEVLQAMSCAYPQQVTGYRIKEDWIFDRNRGEVVVRIAAIGPEVMINDSLRVLFWVKYPDIRDHIAQFAVYRRSTDTTRYNWGSFLEATQFSSTIIQVDGVAKQPTDGSFRKQPPDGKKRKKKDKMSKKEAEMWIY